MKPLSQIGLSATHFVILGDKWGDSNGLALIDRGEPSSRIRELGTTSASVDMALEALIPLMERMREWYGNPQFRPEFKEISERIGKAVAEIEEARELIT